MDRVSFQDLITFAIEKEKDAVVLYEDPSRRETCPEVKEAPEAFAREERRHQSMLEGFLRGAFKISGHELKRIPDLVHLCWSPPA